MEDRTISMGGAAWSALHIASFTKEAFIKDKMAGHAFLDKDPEMREQLLGQMYDLACPVKTKPSRKITKESIEEDQD